MHTTRRRRKKKRILSPSASISLDYFSSLLVFQHKIVLVSVVTVVELNCTNRFACVFISVCFQLKIHRAHTFIDKSMNDDTAARHQYRIHFLHELILNYFFFSSSFRVTSYAFSLDKFNNDGNCLVRKRFVRCFINRCLIFYLKYSHFTTLAQLFCWFMLMCWLFLYTYSYWVRIWPLFNTTIISPMNQTHTLTKNSGAELIFIVN